MRLCSQTEQRSIINTREGICMLHNSDYVLSLSCDMLHSLKYVRGLQSQTLIWAGPWIQSSLSFFLGMESLPFSLIFPFVCTNRLVHWSTPSPSQFWAIIHKSCPLPYADSTGGWVQFPPQSTHFSMVASVSNALGCDLQFFPRCIQHAATLTS